MFPSPFPHPILCGFGRGMLSSWVGLAGIFSRWDKPSIFLLRSIPFSGPFPNGGNRQRRQWEWPGGGEGREFLSHQKDSLSLYWILTIGHLLSLSTHLTISSKVPHHMTHLSQVQQSLGGDSPRNLASFNNHPIQQPWSCVCGLCPSEFGRQVCRQFFLFLSPVSRVCVG